MNSPTCLTLITLALASSLRVRPDPIIIPAYIDRGTLRFDSPDPVPWDSLVPAALREPMLAGDAQRRKQLFAQRSEFGTTEVSFPVPLPVQLQHHSYFLFDSAGIHQFSPREMVGGVLIHWAEGRDSVLAVTVSGQLTAIAPPGSQGGFVLVSHSSASLALESSSLSADSLLAPAGGNYVGKGTAFREIVRQYRIRQGTGSNRWIWVQWRPDSEMVEAGCTLRFSLFRLDSLPVLVATNDSGCDV